MANTQAIQEAILRAVDTVVTQRTNELQLDKTIVGVIKKNIGLKNNKPIYRVQYSGGFIDAICQNVNDVYLPNTGVYVLIPQNDFSRDKIIIGLSDSNVIPENQKVINKSNTYTKLSENLLIEDDTIYGLHSWHDSSNPNDFEDTHQYQYLYKKDSSNTLNISLNQENFNILKDNAIALMIQAEFQTNLDIEQRQKTNATYGLIFNFVYNTLNKGYGETQGEIFDNIAPMIKGSVFDDNSKEYIEYNLMDFDRKIKENDFASVSPEMIQKYYITNIEKVYGNFIKTNAESDVSWMRDIVLKYLRLLTQLSYIEDNALDRKMLYDNWRAVKVGDPSYRYEQYILDSNVMSGNPFAFNQWTNQQIVIEIDPADLNSLDSILFFQEGFNQSYENELIWPPNNPGTSDILVRNLQLYFLDSSSENGIYNLKVEPYNSSPIIENGSDEIQFKATFLKQFYEDLTTNSKTKFYWFKESSSIISYNSEGYSALAGFGWQRIEPTSSEWIFSTNLSNNQAQKNNYKCIVQYDNNILIEYPFTVYRKVPAAEIKLESDLGTEFVFNIGNPTISVKIKDEYNEEFQELGYSSSIIDPDYKYNWCIIDNDNENKIFLNNINQNNAITRILETSLADIEEKILLSNGTLINSFDSEYTTRISFPAAHINTSFTIICYVQRKENGTQNENARYYDIGSAQLTIYNTKKDINIADYRIEIFNDNQVFKYDVYGKAPIDVSNKNSLLIKPLQIKFFTSNNIEINPENYEVEWIFPSDDSTLLIPNNYNKYGCSFSIKNDYNPDYYNNQITCHIIFADRHFYKTTNFYFGKEGSNGTNGTDIIAKIEYARDDDYNNILNEEPLTLYIYKNNNNEMVSFINTSMMRDFSTSQLIFKNPNTNENDNPLFKMDPIFKPVLYQKSEKIDYTSIPTYVLAGNRESRQFLTNNTNVFWTGENANNLNQNTLPLIQNIRAEIKLNDEETYYAFVSLPIIEYKENPINQNQLISIDKHYYLNEIIYNNEGRNPIYNHNQGLKLNLPDNIMRVEYIAKGGFEKQKTSDSEFYYESTPCFSLLENKEEINNKKNVEFVSRIDNNKDIIYVLPNDNYNGSITNNRIEARCYDTNNTLIAVVYAPINMTLNTFGLASLNAWDGNTVTIDDDGGYVMAPQIGAGEKDDNNRFTGILMGKTETYTGKAEKEKQIGLFGYSCGLQSIFLDAETGNATFGLPDGYTIETRNGITVPVEKPNEYDEGRIELRPGGESKIGGWKIGRRSLYYTIKPSPIYSDITKDISNYWEEDGSYIYSYSGEIGTKYKNDEETPQGKQYAEHHKKDINPHEAGILLSSEPPYISIVGTMLTQTQIDNNINGYLQKEDSIELQLDPQTPTVFTIFRHNGEFRQRQAKAEGRVLGDRTFLAGINARGQLQANIIGTTDDSNRQASMYFGLTGLGFENTELPNYMGAIFEAGTSSMVKPFMKLIVHKDELQNDTNIDTTYISIPGNLQIKYNSYRPADVLCIYEE